MEYRVKFRPYTPNSKTTCPQCGRKKSLTNYVNVDTGELFPLFYGKCDREQSCGYHNRPGSDTPGTVIKIVRDEEDGPMDHLPGKEYVRRMQQTGDNYFLQWLGDAIGSEALKILKDRYKLGTSLKHTGFVSFPQIDTEGRLCQIKEMKYDPMTGKRCKESRSQRWAFEKWEFPDLNLKQCYFGLHLTSGNDKPVAIVESEKTAIVCSYFMDDFIWIATGSLTMLTNERCKPLEGKKLTLFPDLGAYDIWKKKARYIKGMREISVSSYLEDAVKMYPLKKGHDLLDLLLLTK